ncbi:hypothetical protein DFAR_2800013 [Desulfarculales bacterium]
MPRPRGLAVNCRVKRDHHLLRLESRSTTAPTGGSLFSQKPDPSFFALNREPFGSDLAPKEIMQTVEVLGVAKRFEYAIRLGPLALVIGNVGGGKFIALRWAASRLHHPGIRSSGSPPHRAPSWSSTGKSASNSKWTPPVSQRPSSPSSSENRSWKSPRTARRKNPPSSSMKPPSSGVKSWPSCTPSLSFRETPSQSCPSSWPARTTSPTSSYTKPPCPWPPGSWPEAIWLASPFRTCRPTSCTTSKSQASNKTSFLNRPSPPYSRAPAALSEGPTTWPEE